MKTRCYNPRSIGYKHYGARGIEICAQWHDFGVFREWALSHGYRDDLTIERIDVNGDYCPENCTWATKVQQANNKTNNRLIEYDGKVMTCREWDRYLGFRPGVMSDRLNTLGWDVERSIKEPVGTSHAQRFTVNGETHSVPEWSKILGISQACLWKRIRNPNLSLEEAFNNPRKGEMNPLSFHGKTLPLSKWADLYSIPMDTLWKRIKE